MRQTNTLKLETKKEVCIANDLHHDGYRSFRSSQRKIWTEFSFNLLK